MNDSGDFQASLRRQARAASVSNRWWENESLASGAADRPAPTLASSLGPPPPPPPPPEAVSYREQARLRLELEAARDEIAALHEMLEDLPEIFERKFRQRVEGLVEEQRRVLADNQLLRDRLYALTPAAPTPLLPPSTSAMPSPRPSRPGLRQAVRAALVSLRPRPRLSPGDDGRTTAA